MRAQLLFYVCVFLNIFHLVHSLRCYTCTVTEDDVDQRCLTDPATVESGQAITSCNKNYCTSMRMEYLDPKGKLQSMYRSCEDKPNIMNEVREDSTYRIYYKACREDLCNGGSGKEISEGGIGNVGNGYGVLYVPGTGSGFRITPSYVLLLLYPLYLLTGHI